MLKYATIPDLSYIPIIKNLLLISPNTSSPSNYRPISHPWLISKLLESINTTPAFSNISNNIIKPHNTAYLPFRNTKTVMNTIINNIGLALDIGSNTFLVLFDLCSAFDTLNHDVLTTRLYEIRIHDQVHAWFWSFISNRRSFIRIHNTISYLLSFISLSSSRLSYWTSLIYHLHHKHLKYTTHPFPTVSLIRISTLWW